MLITCWQSNVKLPGQKCLIVQACQTCHVSRRGNSDTSYTWGLQHYEKCLKNIFESEGIIRKWIHTYIHIYRCGEYVIARFTTQLWAIRVLPTSRHFLSTLALGLPTVISDFAGYSAIVPMSLIFPQLCWERLLFCNLCYSFSPQLILLLPGKY